MEVLLLDAEVQVVAVDVFVVEAVVVAVHHNGERRLRNLPMTLIRNLTVITRRQCKPRDGLELFT